jgi:hypothetical protein
VTVDSDLHVKTAWKLTLTEWRAMTDDERRYCRENVAHALQETR